MKTYRDISVGCGVLTAMVLEVLFPGITPCSPLKGITDISEENLALFFRA
jgi:hypothetical protein